MPILTYAEPRAVMPGGELHLTGTDLGSPVEVEIAGVSALVELARPTQIIVRVPEGILPGAVFVSKRGVHSNALPVRIAVPMAENLHPVANPVVDATGTVYATLSGSRGQQTPVSIFRIPPAPVGKTHELRPFVRNILNPTGLAFGPDGLLYVSSRADGTIYRVGNSGVAQVYAEGLGIATDIAFDRAGDLYVGDRSGTIFKIRSTADGGDRETFVFATLEPSISAYHLAFDSKGVLYVAGPTTSSRQVVYTIDQTGTASVFYQGLGRAQGMAFDAEDNLFIAASLGGSRGIVRITPSKEADLVLSGANIIGLCFLSGGRVAVATRDAIYEVDLGLEGLSLLPW